VRWKIREKEELERTRERKKKELEVQTDGCYFYKVYVSYIYKFFYITYLKAKT